VAALAAIELAACGKSLDVSPHAVGPVWVDPEVAAPSEPSIPGGTSVIGTGDPIVAGAVTAVGLIAGAIGGEGAENVFAQTMRDNRARIAGSADGRVVLVDNANPVGDSFSGRSSNAVRAAVMAIRKCLRAEGIEVVRAVPIEETGGATTTGYLLELDGDGYSVLVAHTVDDDEDPGWVE
jgi:hypothetical protein